MDAKEDSKLSADSGAPPAYSAGSAARHDQPPAYTPPSSFKVGQRTLTSPLVHADELKVHLSLLRAFKRLRTTVEAGEVAAWPELVRKLEAPQRWAWFIGLAVDR